MTIDEGKQLAKVVQETGRIVKVGSWQRRDERFCLAVELIRTGRLGKLQKVEIVLGKNGTSGTLVPRVPPAHLNVTVHTLRKDGNFLMKSVAKLAKSFVIVPSITENLGDFRYKP